MTWEYALIGLVVGIIIGAVAMRFGNRKTTPATGVAVRTGKE
ncbi:cytochrome d ubiquinol oxidase subunit III [Escherichia coli]|uniref:Cytochrome d ubiquinol oxidase subunit III n=1 Tax=Escherichia coli TaxID=562 RepID=A0A2X1JD90_ECOLX|nr:cytochrome d ubiquinol oxidase subunit III [Escherichia coli]